MGSPQCATQPSQDERVPGAPNGSQLPHGHSGRVGTTVVPMHIPLVGQPTLRPVPNYGQLPGVPGFATGPGMYPAGPRPGLPMAPPVYTGPVFVRTRPPPAHPSQAGLVTGFPVMPNIGMLHYRPDIVTGQPPQNPPEVPRQHDPYTYQPAVRHPLPPHDFQRPDYRIHPVEQPSDKADAKSEIITATGMPQHPHQTGPGYEPVAQDTVKNYSYRPLPPHDFERPDYCIHAIDQTGPVVQDAVKGRSITASQPDVEEQPKTEWGLFRMGEMANEVVDAKRWDLFRMGEMAKEPVKQAPLGLWGRTEVTPHDR
eukprot:TRINITY_DN22784_c0_g1_i1.p1 TRINITY_DN22784_c0_g1~~TRINITY_DN22784_c0_g1_i1.p1  ORF type:complete len:312 (+),score=5.38 TRINITY_DN22784_c0_g1_i1:88-1023(+)